MHLAPTEILHVFEAGQRRAEVQRVRPTALNEPYRVVYQSKKSGEVLRDGESEFWTHAPSYHNNEDEAKQRASHWAYRSNT